MDKSPQTPQGYLIPDQWVPELRRIIQSERANREGTRPLKRHIRGGRGRGGGSGTVDCAKMLNLFSPDHAEENESWALTVRAIAKPARWQPMTAYSTGTEVRAEDPVDSAWHLWVAQNNRPNDVAAFDATEAANWNKGDSADEPPPNDWQALTAYPMGAETRAADPNNPTASYHYTADQARPDTITDFDETEETFWTQGQILPPDLHWICDAERIFDCPTAATSAPNRETLTILADNVLSEFSLIADLAKPITAYLNGVAYQVGASRPFYMSTATQMIYDDTVWGFDLSPQTDDLFVDYWD